MIYYPLSVLMLAGIREILIISTPEDTPLFQQLLGDGSQIGLELSYAVQPYPAGIAQAFLIGEPFIGQERVALILGDNLFFGHGMGKLLRAAAEREEGATIFGYYVQNPEQFGVVEFNGDGKAVSIEEKPLICRSHYAVTGLYFYDRRVVDIASNLRPSKRGELEITDINQAYLQSGALQVEILGRGFTWLDSGTHDSLLQASQFIETMEKRQGLKIACIEEIAYRMGYISKHELLVQAGKMGKSAYSTYLLNMIDDNIGRPIHEGVLQ
ncbi:glucose-1-phosphate thymidylyltransferase [Paenibacillus sp. JCM 10914]|nr:glucose-1-phosphate thymidylyltransferase [Paenibacillus sp. JCM 10914]